MSDFFRAIGNMLETGFTWAAFGYALSALENYYNKRQNRKLLYLIAMKLGVKWDTPQEELKKMAQLSYERFYSLSRKETIRRRMIMEKLKSRKFWLTILGALVPIINIQFGLNLDFETIVGIWTMLGVGIAALAHVDAKKILAGLINTKVTVKGIETAFTTFQEAIPYLKEIHADINKLLEDVKKNDGSQAFKDAMQAYAQIKPILDALKHPEPVAVIVEDKVAS